MSEDLTIDRDGLAAEYVLGTLDVDERRAAQALLADDAEFATKVKLWERRLGELHLMVEPVEPEAHVWQRIKAKLPDPPPKPETKPEGTPAEPSLQPEINIEPAREPETAAPEPMHEPEPEPKPESAAKPELERSEEVARKTAAEVNFESAIAAVESALASHGAASAAKSEAAALAVQQTPAVEPTTAPPAPGTAGRPAAGAAPVAPESDLGAAPARATGEQLRAAKRHLAGWRALALVMSLVVLAMVGLVAVWKYAPDRLPTEVQPLALMRLLGIHVEAAGSARPPAPPESQYDE